MKRLNLKDLTPEMMREMSGFKTADELVAYAKAKGYEMSPKFAERMLGRFGSSKLSDDALEMVSGGGMCDAKTKS